MTTNQTIDGVPRELVRENIAYLRGMGGTHDQKSALAAKFELLLLDPAPLKDLREQYEAWADSNGYDITRNEHGDYTGIVEDSMWTGWQARGELRALLDAPAPPSVAVGHIEQRRSMGLAIGAPITNVIWDLPHPELQHLPNGAKVYLHPAAQPQGDPVAFQWRCKTVNEGSQWRHWVDCTEEDYNKTIENPGPTPRGIIREARKLYAEQPAPVAVVLPQKLKSPAFKTVDRGSVNYAAGWNAYDTELKRLNPSL